MNKIAALGIEGTNDELLDSIKKLCEENNLDFEDIIRECNIEINDEFFQKEYIRDKDFQTLMKDFSNVDEIDIHSKYIKKDGYDHLESIDQVDIDTVYDYYSYELSKSKDKEVGR